MARIGFIGLGRMGLPMLRHLVEAGHTVRAFDISETARAEARAAGAEVVATCGEVAAGAEYAISMVPTGRHVLEVHTGSEGTLARLPADALLIDCSTIAVAEARALHEAGRNCGIAVLDAPVSGGVMGAQAGTLTFMVGGDHGDLDRARPILETMGRNVFHAGPAGNGQAAKVCNNLLAGISMIAVSEAFTLGKRLGLDPATMRDIVSTSTGSCHALVSYPPVPGLLPNVPSSREYRNGFAADLMLKDLRLAERAAMETGSSLPIGTLATALYSLFCGGGSGTLDYSGVIRMIEGAPSPAANS
ncbi:MULTISPECIES: 3-hydroxyisobutyrate dehydrogenase [unclassified Methylobacterium]|uniref:3-hydroxyisobutyrate dehydrogenase n=1 Tax=unclassified Methylobacterium TaxID=2615210 RepID=UPI0011C1FB1B|nr:MULTISPECIES: 3-hydroxyisobutyrate dehydrogenase [unclassified Methylobacterium]MCJ2116297.1 3-hydroxyisobutyrate dehydrogenase [Methylobacterium sp. J-001]QEE41658.1 3-hydroxyisobutyrate dehydrogenase [Methylobacterium sp. WL1]TXN54971.1 3-hydroxyisobutyrate dehydrogenase [Methylobacterium sp. WL2]